MVDSGVNGVMLAVNNTSTHCTEPSLGGLWMVITTKANALLLPTGTVVTDKTPSHQRAAAKLYSLAQVHQS